MKTRIRQQKTVDLSADQEALAQRIFERIRGKLDHKLLDIVRTKIGKAPEDNWLSAVRTFPSLVGSIIAGSLRTRPWG